MARRDRSGADQAGVGPDPTQAGRLRSIREVRDLNIAEGEPDIRGWEVRTLSGRRIGSVDDLLVDLDRREIVMIDVDLKDGGRHAEVPIRAAQLDRSRHCVIIDSADAEPVGDAFDRRFRDRLEDRQARRTERADLAEREAHEAHPVEEIVVEKRPVVMEETVVRRRPVGEEDLDHAVESDLDRDTDPDRRVDRL